MRREILPESSSRALNLMLAAQQGDRDAFSGLVRILTPALTRAAHHMVRPPYADDLVQETWLRAWKYRNTYRGEAQPLTWLHTIMAKTAVTRALRPSGEPFDPLAGPSTSGDHTPDEAHDREILLLESQVFGRMDPDEAFILQRLGVSERSYGAVTELAQEMGIEPEVLRSQLRTAERHFRKTWVSLDRQGLVELRCADAITDALLRLDDSHAMVIRRRYLEEQDWKTITAEMGFSSVYRARRTFQEAMAKLAAIYTKERETP